MEGSRVIPGSFTVIKQCIGCRLSLEKSLEITQNKTASRSLPSDMIWNDENVRYVTGIMMFRKDLPEAAQFLDQFVLQARHSQMVREQYDDSSGSWVGEPDYMVMMVTMITRWSQEQRHIPKRWRYEDEQCMITNMKWSDRIILPLRSRGWSRHMEWRENLPLAPRFSRDLEIFLTLQLLGGFWKPLEEFIT